MKDCLIQIPLNLNGDFIGSFSSKPLTPVEEKALQYGLEVLLSQRERKEG